MKIIQGCDPAMWCATRCCGIGINPDVVNLPSMLARLSWHHIAYQIFNLRKKMQMFAEIPQVKQLLEIKGKATLELEMSTYLEDSLHDQALGTVAEIRSTVVQAALKRIRSSLMTLAITSTLLMPIFWATGLGADVMQPMAIPAVGGITAHLITGLIAPVNFYAVERAQMAAQNRAATPPHACGVAMTSDLVVTDANGMIYARTLANG